MASNNKVNKANYTISMIQKCKMIETESRKLAMSMQLNELKELLNKLKDFKVSEFPE